jgi:hypothetical protein
MQRVALSSSVIASVGFDPSTHTLDVRFHSGKNYRYFMVPASVYEALIRSESIGAFFNREIRDRYRFVEVT